MITFILFSVIVIFVTIMYGLWAIIFPVMSKPPKLLGFHKLEDYQWVYFKLKLAPAWFFRSAIPLAILNAILSYNIAGSVSFKDIFASDLNFFQKLLTSFTSYFDFFFKLGTSYVVIFVLEFIISSLVLRYKAASQSNIEIIPTTGNFDTEVKQDSPPKDQKQITD